MSKLKDLTGKKFGELTVISLAEVVAYRTKWNCLCSCGEKTVVFGSNLNRKKRHTTSCGCRRDRLAGTYTQTHGLSNTKEYNIWSFVKVRCLNKNCVAYPRYGGRGIRMCDSWVNSFENFLADVGHCPSDIHSLDRIDNDGNYEPGNVRWATPTEQANNKTNSVFFNMDGITDTLPNWCRKFGVPSSTIWARIRKHGWTFEKAITTPVRKFTKPGRSVVALRP